jgi:hypothetical protein
MAIRAPAFTNRAWVILGRIYWLYFDTHEYALRSAKSSNIFWFFCTRAQVVVRQAANPERYLHCDLNVPRIAAEHRFRVIEDGISRVSIVAPGIADPDASCTVPVRPPLMACASRLFKQRTLWQEPETQFDCMTPDFHATSPVIALKRLQEQDKSGADTGQGIGDKKALCCGGNARRWDRPRLRHQEARGCCVRLSILRARSSACLISAFGAFSCFSTSAYSRRT